MLLLKIVLLPIVVGLADLMTADIFFPSAWSIAITGIVLAIIGWMMEALILRRGTLWLTTVVDWGVAAAGIYLAQYIFNGAYASVVGSLLAGGLIAIVEYFAHRSAIRRMAGARH